ncbi:hypothetical protein FNV43_RR27138 [Rhamnella rubrinervis]|uniref:KIB1-4 beta-propeller domain-containing protein n=1 Tax=Rhamnella rubrinervis TaxID=2594499 RepID=A0A8K0DNW3_9ROSA|nr:hypothetical protein FNV43_RR27138 [Rhamnella rubrinervis]
MHGYGGPTKPQQPPLLLLLGELSGETKHAFADLTNNACSGINFPELESQSECLSSRFGWLLILSRQTSSLFFFNPITHNRINLPYLKHNILIATFSAPPTSPNCTVFTIKMPFDNSTSLRIDTLTLGHKHSAWIPQINHSKGLRYLVDGILVNGLLYCVDLKGSVGIFDLKQGSWKVFSCKGSNQRVRFSYLVEFSGEVYAVRNKSFRRSGVVVDKRVLIQRLKIDDGHGFAVWEDGKFLGGVSVYVGPYGSCVIPVHDEGLKEEKRKFVVANHGPESKCVVYDVEDDDHGCVYHKRTTYGGKYFGWCYAPVWIERD